MATRRYPHLGAVAVLLILVASFAIADPSPRRITDKDIKAKKNACYADIESGLWGRRCRSSMIDKENCALRCLSPGCYEIIYESDPLEEGEKDASRSLDFKHCIHRESLGESLERVKADFGY